MANLIFKYGAMNSGKTINILQTLHSYDNHGLKAVLIKSVKDTKGKDYITSRTGLKRKVDILLKNESLLQEKYYKIYYNARVILVDEVELLSVNQIDELWSIAHLINVPVIVYGIKSNFKGEIFSDSVAHLFAVADKSEEIGSVSLCSCGKSAVFNARKVNKKFTDTGELIIIDGAQKGVEYIALCGDCYLKYVKINSKSIKKLTKLVEKIN